MEANSSARRVWRVAYRPPSPAVPSCLFDVPRCEAASDDLSRIVLFILSALLPPGAQLRFVPAPRWKIADMSRPEEDRTSVMGLVYNGLADFTQPDMFVTERRVRLMPSLGRLRTQRHIVVYRERDLSRRTGLDFDAVVNKNFYISVAVAAVLLKLFASAYRRFSQRKATWRTWDYFLRAYRRNGVIVGIIVTFFLRFLSSDIILILNKLTPPQARFGSLEDVAEALEEGSFKALVSYPISHLFFFQHGGKLSPGSVGRRIADSARANPPVKMYESDEAQPLQSSVRRILSGEPLLLITSETDWLFILGMSFNGTGPGGLDVCSLAFVVAEEMPASWETVYHTPGLRFRRPGAFLDRRMVGAEWERIRSRYLPVRRCLTEHRVTGRDPLELQQVIVPFVLFSALAALAIAVFALELVTGLAQLLVHRIKSASVRQVPPSPDLPSGAFREASSTSRSFAQPVF